MMLVKAVVWGRKVTRKNFKGSDSSGFTLIEIITVISIMAVLGSIIVLSVKNVTLSSQEKACQADWRAINAAASAYFDDTQVEASNLGSLIATKYYALPDGATYASQTGISRGSYTMTFSNGVITVSKGGASSTAVVGARSAISPYGLLPDACTIVIS